MSAVEELGRTVAEAAAKVGPSVVGLGRGWGTGSGVVVADGRVLTSAHNLRGEEATVSFADGRRESATLAGADPDLDVAVLAVDTGDGPPVAWEPAVGAPGLGTPVVALASPGGRGLRATLGLVSSEPRSFRGPRGRRVEGGIEHTAPLPRGSSGGPLVDTEGRLLGLNTLRLEGGLILALATDTALRQRTEALAEGRAPEPRRLGVAVAPPRAARRMRRAVGLPDRSGLLVRQVLEASPADRAGLERGDLLVAAAGRELDGLDALHGALDRLPVGEPLALTLVRGVDEQQVSVTFDEDD